MLKRQSAFIFLTTLSICSFILANHVFEGSLSNVDSLKRELKSRDSQLSTWNLNEEAPFKYRILFPHVVSRAATLIYGDPADSQFYLTYYTISMLIYVASVLIFFTLLNTLGFHQNLSMIGTLIFVFSPPFLLAYTLPVHTREDILGYSLLFAGLISMLNNRSFLTLIFCVLAILTRETLMILPLVFMLYSGFSRWSILTIIISFGVLVSTRLIIGVEGYSLLEGWSWNIANPIIAIGFAFLSFHLLWFTAFSQFKSVSLRKRNYHGYAPLIYTLVISSTVLFGKMNEIRLFYIMAPWIIPNFLRYLDKNKNQLLVLVCQRSFLISSGALLLLTALLGFFLIDSGVGLGGENKYSIPIKLWIIAGLVYIYLTLVFFLAAAKMDNETKHAS